MKYDQRKRKTTIQDKCGIMLNHGLGDAKCAIFTNSTISDGLSNHTPPLT